MKCIALIAASLAIGLFSQEVLQDPPYENHATLEDKTPESVSNLTLEVKAAYFIPTSSTTRDIYGDSAITGLSFHFPIYYDLIGWIQTSYLKAKGKTLGLSNKTTMQLVPFVAGLNFAPRWGWFQPYIGLGIEPAYLHVENSSPYMIHKSAKWGVGGIAIFGMMFNLPYSLFLDFFGEYSYLKIPFHDSNHGKVVPRTADVSGVDFGAGIGYRF